MVTVAGVAAALIRMLSFVGGPVGPLRGSGLGLGASSVGAIGIYSAKAVGIFLLSIALTFIDFSRDTSM